MCRSCTEHASSNRSRRRCTDPVSNAAAARSNHAVKIIKRVVTAVVEPEPLPAEPSLDVPRLQQLIREALAKGDTATGAAALAELKKTYGSVDLAVAAVGATVQARAEVLAGITADEIKAGHDRRIVETADRYEAAKDALSATDPAANPGQPIEPFLAALEDVNVAKDAHKAAKAGTDEATAEEMRRLIDGRLAALTEMQEMGGEHTFAPGSDQAVVAALNETSKYYPSAWLAISRSGLEIAAVSESGSQGHYLDKREIPVNETSRRIDTDVFAPQDAPVDPDPWGDFAPTGEKWPDGREVYSREFWQVATKHLPRDADGKPTSNEPWEEWAHPTTGEISWRHPAMQTRTAGSKTVSEFSVGPTNPANVAGMEKFHPIAVHEQAHRFEGVIQNIEALEDMFLTRRTTLPDGTLEKVQAYNSSVNVRADHFSEKYTGRRYKHGGNELLSTGMEAVFAGQYGGFLGIGGRLPDAELQNFVLGVLVTCQGKRADS